MYCLNGYSSILDNLRSDIVVKLEVEKESLKIIELWHILLFVGIFCIIFVTGTDVITFILRGLLLQFGVSSKKLQ